MATESLKQDDKVVWDAPHGEVKGEMVKKVTGTKSVKGHTATASPGEPQYEVKSDKSGKHAVHKPEELRKR